MATGCEQTGVRTAALMERRQRAVARGLFHTTPVFVERAHGARVYDVDGRVYIDFAGGIGVLNVGHVPARVAQAVHAQVDRLIHTCFHVAMYEPYVSLAERLNQITPGDFPKKTILLNSGAEAVENAIKIARAYTGRPGIICFDYAFHGRTLLGMTLTGKTVPYKRGFGPLAAEVYRAPYPYTYRAPAGMTPAMCTEACLEQLNLILHTQTAPEQVAAIIIEPVLGEGGFLVPPPGFLQGVQEIARRHGILLIVDEIQTGFGRTGTLFACEQFGIIPDILTLAKSLAAGLPLSAVVGRAEVMDAPPPGSLGGTYGGNPVACAAALAVLDMFAEEDLLSRAQEVGRITRARLEAMYERYPLIGEVRGLGAMLAVELVRDRQTREPATAETEAVIRYCSEHGLLVLKAGLYNNVVRFLMPLTIDHNDLYQGLDVFEQAIATVQRVSGG